MINLIEFDKSLKAEVISVPTIIIWGKNDGITPVSDGKVLNQKITNSKLYIINNICFESLFFHKYRTSNVLAYGGIV